MNELLRLLSIMFDLTTVLIFLLAFPAYIVVLFAIDRYSLIALFSSVLGANSLNMVVRFLMNYQNRHEIHVRGLLHSVLWRIASDFETVRREKLVRVSKDESTRWQAVAFVTGKGRRPTALLDLARLAREHPQSQAARTAAVVLDEELSST